MIFNDSADSKQLSVHTEVLDEYCRQAGIGADRTARQKLERRLMELFRGGMEKPAELFAALNTGYDEWLGEVGLSNKAKPAESPEPTSAHLEPDIAHRT